MFDIYQYFRKKYYLLRIDHLSPEQLLISQPTVFKVFSAFVCNTYSGDRIDCTEKFVRLWAKNSFKELLFHVADFTDYYDEYTILEVEYQYREFEVYKILYTAKIVYPPYTRNDSRILEFRSFAQDIKKAHLVSLRNKDDSLQKNLCDSPQRPVCSAIQEYMNSSSVAQDQDSPIIYRNISVTDDLSLLRGPGGIFYCDTPVSITEATISSWVKSVHKQPERALVVTFANDIQKEFMAT